MRTALRIPLAAFLLIGAAQAAQAFDPFGIWVRSGGEKFDVYNCDNKICGKLFDVAKPEDKGGIGQVILRNAAKDGENHWTGEVYNPQDGKTYKAKITLNSATDLTMEGCLSGFLCKGETWTRAPDQKGASTPGGKPVKPAFTAAKQ